MKRHISVLIGHRTRFVGATVIGDHVDGVLVFFRVVLPVVATEVAGVSDDAVTDGVEVAARLDPVGTAPDVQSRIGRVSALMIKVFGALFRMANRLWIPASRSTLGHQAVMASCASELDWAGHERFDFVRGRQVADASVYPFQVATVVDADGTGTRVAVRVEAVSGVLGDGEASHASGQDDRKDKLLKLHLGGPI